LGGDADTVAYRKTLQEQQLQQFSSMIEFGIVVSTTIADSILRRNIGERTASSRWSTRLAVGDSRRTSYSLRASTGLGGDEKLPPLYSGLKLAPSRGEASSPP